MLILGVSEIGHEDCHEIFSPHFRFSHFSKSFLIYHPCTTKKLRKNIKIGLLYGCSHTIKVSGGGSLPKPHECAVSRGEE